MKKTLLNSVILFTLLFSPINSFCKGCIWGLHVGGKIYYSNDIHPQVSADTLFNIGDSINLPISITQFYLGLCTCSMQSIRWIHNAMQISSDTVYTVIDTGEYNIFLDFVHGTWCAESDSEFVFNLHVGYNRATSVTSISNPTLLQIYPSVSSTFFRIKTSEDYHLKKISVTDSQGRIVYTSSTNFSEINLTRFTNGIYFYEVEDELQRVFRGKIVKD